MRTSATEPGSRGQRTRWAWLVGTLFGIGHLPAGPGTWASAATVLLWWFLSTFVSSTHLVIYGLAITCAIIAIGIPASTVVARESGVKDPGFVVIDEVAGQMIPLIIAPVRWKYLLVSLILFRCFDILKPPPLRMLERLPDGVGIMFDDVGAGVYALMILVVLMKLWPAL